MRCQPSKGSVAACISRCPITTRWPWSVTRSGPQSCAFRHGQRARRSITRPIAAVRCVAIAMWSWRRDCASLRSGRVRRGRGLVRAGRIPLELRRPVGTLELVAEACQQRAFLRGNGAEAQHAT